MRNESKKCQLLCQEETSAQQILKIMTQLETMEPGSIPSEKARMWGRTQGRKKQKQKEIYIYIYIYIWYIYVHIYVCMYVCIYQVSRKV